VTPRENAEAKGRRYLGEGRLTVTGVSAGRVEAECRGFGAAYRVGWNSDGWRCNCPARSLCAHLVALMLVVVREREAA
jgi:uncharacterized Zn finger protein